MKVRTLTAIPCILAIVWSTSVYADVLVLRDGGKLDGILSNRERVQNDPSAFREISFLVGSGPDAILRRFPTSEIEWILIEAPDGPAVVDFAQFTGSGPVPLRAPEKRPDRKTAVHLDLKGGLTWALFDGDGSEEFHEFRNGMTFGAGLTMLRGKYGGASFGAFYVQKGARGRTSAQTGRVAEVEFRMDYIEVPAVAVVRIPLRNAAIRAFAGPSLAFLVKSTTVGQGWAYFGSPELDGENDISDETSSLDVGLKFGLGVELPLNKTTMLLFEGGYGRTISSFDDTRSLITWTHGVLSAEVGISFALTRDDTDDQESKNFPSRWERR